MARFLGTPKVQYFKTGSSEFLEGGLLYSYNAGTLTPRATYSTIADALAGTNPNTNPIELNARGEADVVISGATKLILKDEDGNTIWTVDNIDTSQDVYDGNGNEVLKFVGVASAANEVTLTNAITGSAPIFSSSSNINANVGLKVTSKGSGTLNLDGGSTGGITLGSTSTGTISLNRVTVCNSTLSVNGAVDLNSSLNVDGGAAFNGPVTFDYTQAISILPVGMIVPYAGTSVNPPAGWFFCNGNAISRTQYSTLFNALGSGTAWGVGDGSTTFNLPDFRGYTLVGSGGPSDATLGNTVGSAGGSRTHTLTSTEMPAHTHTYTEVLGTTAVQGAGVPTPYTAVTTGTTGIAGGGGAHNNIQPSKIIQWIIKAF